MTLDVDRLPVYRDARAFRVIAERIAKESPRGQSDLAGQLRSASNSIVENISEGAGEFAPAEKARFYRIARRSAVECVGITDMYADLAFIDATLALDVRARLTSIVSQLVLLITRFTERQSDEPCPLCGRPSVS
jgi:four helix bundle protein